VGAQNRSGACRIRIGPWLAWAYLAVFCSAPRQQKYTAASGVLAEPPDPVGLYGNGTGDLLA
jgi:hypothetical protein